MVIPEKIIIHYEWNGMCCKNCYRYSTNGKCDLLDEQSPKNYCKLYIPHPRDFTKLEIIQLMLMHTQRFIKEAQQ
jgi:hypothetical protein